MAYNTILFDLDGTLADTSPGITSSVNYALASMGYETRPYEYLFSNLGAALPEYILTIAPEAKNDIDELCKRYREYYGSVGQFNATVFDGTENVLHTLKAQGRKLGVASLKNDQFTVSSVTKYGLTKYFDVIAGSWNDVITKADVVNSVLAKLQVEDRTSVVLIGDSKYDLEGARDAGISFIGVDYGFGFGKKDICEGEHVLSLISHPSQILDLI